MNQAVGKKISKVRWSPSSLHEPNTAWLAVGSRDEEKNVLHIYCVKLRGKERSIQSINRIQSLFIDGSVTGIHWWERNGIPSFFLSSTNGGIEEYSCNGFDEMVFSSTRQLFSGENRIVASDFGRNVMLASIGEKCDLNLFDVHRGRQVMEIKDVDPYVLYDVKILVNSLICTVGSTIQLWDARKKNSVATLSSIASAPKKHSPLCYTTVAGHPIQSDILVTGDEVGNLLGWDLRRSELPLFTFQKLDTNRPYLGPIWECSFHPSKNYLFSCGEDGNACLWSIKNDYSLLPLEEPGGGSNHLSRFSFAKKMFSDIDPDDFAKSFLPLRTLDCHPSWNVVVCGGEAENLYFNYIKE